MKVVPRYPVPTLSRARWWGPVWWIVGMGAAAGVACGTDVPTGRGGGDCDPACAPPEVCSGGRCVVGVIDFDEDGIAADYDCDDNDYDVGSAAERVCDTACGAGIERCNEGIWTACAFEGGACTCVDGEEPRVVACNPCGDRTQICVGGEWIDEGPCVGCDELDAGTPETDAGMRDAGTPVMTECSPGETASDSGSCGECNEGTHTRTRTCSGDGTWPAWGTWSSCSTTAQCSPGQVGRDSRSCCGSGTQTRTRSCNTTTCRWNAYGSWSACSSGSGCTPGATRACRNGDPCGRETCNSSCNWTSCQVAPGNECLRIRPGTSGPLGNNWRCCGSSRWQFCLSSCTWSTACALCSGCGC